MIRLLMGMASKQSHLWFLASSGAVGEAGDVARGLASKSRAESTAALIYIIQMYLAMGIRLIDADF